MHDRDLSHLPGRGVLEPHRDANSPQWTNVIDHFPVWLVRQRIVVSVRVFSKSFVQNSVRRKTIGAVWLIEITVSIQVFHPRKHDIANLIVYARCPPHGVSTGVVEGRWTGDSWRRPARLAQRIVN